MVRIGFGVWCVCLYGIKSTLINGTREYRQHTTHERRGVDGLNVVFVSIATHHTTTTTTNTTYTFAALPCHPIVVFSPTQRADRKSDDARACMNWMCIDKHYYGGGGLSSSALLLTTILTQRARFYE